MTDDQDRLAGIEGVEIEPLSDEALEQVAGGVAAGTNSGPCSCVACSALEPSSTDPAAPADPAGTPG